MTNYKTTTTTQNKLICQAVKKDGKACKYKAKCGSKYCGIHKNFIDTSKTLFTDEEEDDEPGFFKNKGTYKFKSMTGNNYEITQDTPTLQVYAVKEIKRKYKIDFMTDVLIFEEGKEEPLKKTDIIYADTNNLFVVEQIKMGLKEEIERLEPFIIDLVKYSIKDKQEELEEGQDTPTKAQFNIIYNNLNKYQLYRTHTNWTAYDIMYHIPNNIKECAKQINKTVLDLLQIYEFEYTNTMTVMDTIINRIITTNKLDQYETYY